jgi:hypothetical protein
MNARYALVPMKELSGTAPADKLEKERPQPAPLTTNPPGGSTRGRLWLRLGTGSEHLGLF